MGMRKLLQCLVKSKAAFAASDQELSAGPHDHFCPRKPEPLRPPPLADRDALAATSYQQLTAQHAVKEGATRLRPCLCPPEGPGSKPSSATGSASMEQDASLTCVSDLTYTGDHEAAAASGVEGSLQQPSMAWVLSLLGSAKMIYEAESAADDLVNRYGFMPKSFSGSLPSPQPETLDATLDPTLTLKQEQQQQQLATRGGRPAQPAWRRQEHERSASASTWPVHGDDADTSFPLSIIGLSQPGTQLPSAACFTQCSATAALSSFPGAATHACKVNYALHQRCYRRSRRVGSGATACLDMQQHTWPSGIRLLIAGHKHQFPARNKQAGTSFSSRVLALYNNNAHNNRRSHTSRPGSLQTVEEHSQLDVPIQDLLPVARLQSR